MTGQAFFLAFAIACGCGIFLALGLDFRHPWRLGTEGMDAFVLRRHGRHRRSAAASVPLVAQRKNAAKWGAAAALPAAVFLFLAGGNVLLNRAGFEMRLGTFPFGNPIVFGMNPLSAFFAAITGLVAFPSFLFFGQRSARAGGETSGGRSSTILYLLIFLSTGCLFAAQDILSFLMVWEISAILTYLLVARGENRERAPRAAYFLQAGFLSIVAAFLVLWIKSGASDFTAIARAAAGFPAPVGLSIFLLSFFGFGVKAGLVPVNFWLPPAYTEAPDGFSPFLAGAMLNMGFYGILLVNLLFLRGASLAAGIGVMTVGTLSAFVGILYATVGRHMKTVLAHSSIENAGIGVTALGAGMIFLHFQFGALAAIALVAAFYHILNHSLYKTLLFIGAGAVKSGTGKQNMNELGGLLKKMPLTGALFLIGVLAISAFPPFNGFVSEWLVLQSLLQSAVLQSIGVKLAFAFAGALLALTAALAITCFMKVFGISFLGMPRSEEAESACEQGRGGIAAMGFLALLVLGFGIFPTLTIPLLDNVVTPLAGASAATALIPPFFTIQPGGSELPAGFVKDFHDLGAQVGRGILPGTGMVVLHRGGAANPVVFAMSTFYTFFVLIFLLALTYFVARLCARRRSVSRGEVWDGGIRRLLPTMTYTATGFSNPVRVIFQAIVNPTAEEETREMIGEHFYSAIRRKDAEVHVVDRVVVKPLGFAMGQVSRFLSDLHNGRVNRYVAYVFVTFLLLLLLAIL